jgi:uncharacterized repeat protein (TIGR01451 family)
MKTFKTLLTILLASVAIESYGQYVSLPDTLLGKWLKNNGFNSCITGTTATGYQLDTTCSNVLSATSLDMSCTGGVCAYHFRDLTGIRYFKNLITLRVDYDSNMVTLPTLPPILTGLYCSHSKLANLPVLPSTLRYLYLQYDNLTNLPALPAGLIKLVVNSNHFTSLSGLPASLDTLIITDNPLGALPVIPSSVRHLECWYNGLTNLTGLPPNLRYLNCGNNVLRTLPTLPASLTTLDCSMDSLTSLPALPVSLTELTCSYNRFTNLSALTLSSLRRLTINQCAIRSLPSLPRSLREITCSHNMLANIPALPDSLTSLDCSFNQLTELPAFPQTLYAILCNYNVRLTCLPHIYRSVSYFAIAHTNIHCVDDTIYPRFGVITDTYLGGLAICGPLSECNSYYNVSGLVSYDSSSTCMQDSINSGPALHRIKVQLKKNNEVVKQTYTSVTGGYFFHADSLGGYDVTVAKGDTSFAPACPLSGTQHVLLSASDSVSGGVNFSMVCQSSDYGAFSITYPLVHTFRPAAHTLVHFLAGNNSLIHAGRNCGTCTSGTVIIVFRGAVSYVGPGPGALTPAAVAGKTLTYAVSDLCTLSAGSLDVIFATDTTAPIGSTICFSMAVIPSTPDDYPDNDTTTQCLILHNSSDPNLKEVYPMDTFENGEWLTYTIHFQNVGNDTAYIITVKDTLDNNLDASSFQYIASSHQPSVQIDGRAMTFSFPDIRLVDSATNPALSEGWIQYKVKPKPNLPLHAQVKNSASIYFDTNPAIVTNTTVNTLGIATGPSGIMGLQNEDAIHLYPNPNNGTFTLRTSCSMNRDYTISDMLGHVLHQKMISTDAQIIDMSDTSPGVYVLQVTGSRPVRFSVVK